MDYAQSAATAPAGWTHFRVADLDRLPPAVKSHEMARVPASEQERLARGDHDAGERLLKAFFWTFVYHLEPFHSDAWWSRDDEQLWLPPVARDTQGLHEILEQYGWPSPSAHE